MKVPVRRLIPAGFLACIAAPLTYLLYILGSTLTEGRAIDFILLLTILVSSTMFSFMATMVVVFLTIGVARVMNLEAVNVAFVAVSYLIVLGVITLLIYGAREAAVLLLLATPNALVLIWSATRSGNGPEAPSS